MPPDLAVESFVASLQQSAQELDACATRVLSALPLGHNSTHDEALADVLVAGARSVQRCAEGFAEVAELTRVHHS